VRRAATILKVILAVLAQDDNTDGSVGDEAPEVGLLGDTATPFRVSDHHKLPRLPVPRGGGQAATVDNILNYFSRHTLVGVHTNTAACL
jgi:hypothetical protein